MSTIEDAIKTRLTTHPALGPLVGARVFPQRIPQGAAWPAVRYARISAVRPYVSTVPNELTRARYQFDAYAPDFDTAAACRRALVNALERWSDPVGDPVIQTVFVESEGDHDEPEAGREGLFRCRVDAEINYQETQPGG